MTALAKATRDGTTPKGVGINSHYHEPVALNSYKNELPIQVKTTSPVSLIQEAVLLLLLLSATAFSATLNSQLAEFSNVNYDLISCFIDSLDIVFSLAFRACTPLIRADYP